MMPVEEDKELKDLVTETLQSKGVLGKVQAEIRASVFLALEEQDVFKDKSPFINKPLKDYVKTSDGLIVLSLVREFLEFYNLEFTSMVFDPETHAGIDYEYEGRAKLAQELMLSSNDSEKPLLAQILSILRASANNHKTPSEVLKSCGDTTMVDAFHPVDQTSLTNGVHGDGNGRLGNHCDTDLSEKNNLSEHLKKTQNSLANEQSLASLSNLPPLKKTPSDHDPNDLNALIERGLSNESKNDAEEIRNESESEESEIVEEIASNCSNVSGFAGISSKSCANQPTVKIGSTHSIHDVPEFSQDKDLLAKPSKSSKRNNSETAGSKTPKNSDRTTLQAKTFCLTDETESSYSGHLDFDSKCDTISEIDEIDEELSSKACTSLDETEIAIFDVNSPSEPFGSLDRMNSLWSPEDCKEKPECSLSCMDTDFELRSQENPSLADRGKVEETQPQKELKNCNVQLRRQKSFNEEMKKLAESIPNDSSPAITSPEVGKTNPSHSTVAVNTDSVSRISAVTISRQGTSGKCSPSLTPAISHVKQTKTSISRTSGGSICFGKWLEPNAPSNASSLPPKPLNLMKKS